MFVDPIQTCKFVNTNLQKSDEVWKNRDVSFVANTWNVFPQNAAEEHKVVSLVRMINILWWFG